MSFSRLTNESGPSNSMPFGSRNWTFTSGFLPGTIENSINSKCSVRNFTGAMSWRSNGESEHEISALGSFPGRVGAWISTASVERAGVPRAEWPEDRVVGRVVRVRPGLEVGDPVETGGHDLGELQSLGKLEKRGHRRGDRGRVLQLVLDAATDADDLFLRRAGKHVGTRALDRAEERTDGAGDRVQVAGQVRGSRGVGIGREDTEIGEQRVDHGHDRGR